MCFGTLQRAVSLVEAMEVHNGLEAALEHVASPLVAPGCSAGHRRR